MFVLLTVVLVQPECVADAEDAEEATLALRVMAALQLKGASTPAAGRAGAHVSADLTFP